jgi:hypothetical protein
MAEPQRQQAAVLALVAGTFALDCYSTFCSSPQTTELNASARAGTLMKWVSIGGGVAVAGGVVASVYSGSWAPIVGALAVTLLLWYCYAHAKRVGLQNGGTPTESY